MATAQHDDFQEHPVRMLGLRELKDENFVQCRVQTDVGHARKITDFVLKNGPISEPIVVFFDGQHYYVADGIHRVIGYRQAARVNGRFKQIRAEIRDGSNRDALVYAAGANQEKTYLKRSREDVSNAFWKLMDDEEWRSKSVSCIASIVGISNSSAKRLWVEYFRKNNLELPLKVECKNGVQASSSRPNFNSICNPNVRTDSQGRNSISFLGKYHYLGKDKDEAENKISRLKYEYEERKSRYESKGSVKSCLTYSGIHSEPAFSSGSSLANAGLSGLNVGRISVTWESFRDFRSSVTAIGRAVCCREMIRAKRTVVLCPVEDGPPEVLELGRKAGIEFMTIEDFVASLQADAAGEGVAE